MWKNQSPVSPFNLSNGASGGIGENHGTFQIDNLPSGNRNNRRQQGGFVRSGSKTGNQQSVSIRKQNDFNPTKKLPAKNSTIYYE